MARPSGMSARAAALPLAVVGTAVLVFCLPQLSALLVYDRQAILAGQLWRLATAPLVHFSVSHLCWDGVVFAAAGWAVEAAGYRGFRLLCALAAVIPGLFFLGAVPELGRYGGLSGLATGAVAYLCFCRMGARSKGSWIWLAILALMSLKILVETTTAGPLFVQTGSTPFRVLPAAHLIGLGTALATRIAVRPVRNGAPLRHWFGWRSEEWSQNVETENRCHQHKDINSSY
jgi:rhomboid family GlyGly-CTERM serine protease